MNINEIINLVSGHTGKNQNAIKSSVTRAELRPARIMVSVLAILHNYPHELISYTLGKKHKSFSCRLVKELDILSKKDILFLLENSPDCPAHKPSAAVFNELKKKK